MVVEYEKHEDRSRKLQTVHSGGFESEFEQLVSIGRHIGSIEVTNSPLGALLACARWRNDECVLVAGSKVRNRGFVHLLPNWLKSQWYEYNNEQGWYMCRRISGLENQCHQSWA